MYSCRYPAGGGCDSVHLTYTHTSQVISDLGRPSATEKEGVRASTTAPTSRPPPTRPTKLSATCMVSYSLLAAVRRGLHRARLRFGSPSLGRTRGGLHFDRKTSRQAGMAWHALHHSAGARYEDLDIVTPFVIRLAFLESRVVERFWESYHSRHDARGCRRSCYPQSHPPWR